MPNNLKDTQVDRLVVRNNDMKRRRVVNASPSVDPNDYIIQDELNILKSQITELIARSIAGIKFPPAFDILVKDQADLAALNLQENKYVWVEDYGHLLYWDNTTKTFQFGPGDNGSGYVMPFVVSPNSPLWQLCNGATTSRLNGDGTLTTGIVLPNWSSNPAYIKAASSYSGPLNTAKVLPVTLVDSTHVVSVPTTGGTNVNTSAHVHIMTLPGDPVDHVEMPYYFRR